MRIKFGSIVVDGRNKLGGHVYSKNRGGNYVRTNIVPTNPRSAAQMEARGIFAMASAGWKQLTQSARDRWVEFAQDNKYQDIFGDSRSLSANSAFVRSTVNTINAGITSLAGPVTVDESFTSTGLRLTATETSGDIALMFGNSDTSRMGNARFIVHTTGMFPASQKYATNKFRMLANYGGTSIVNNELDITSDYVAKHGALVEGQRIAISIVLIKSNGLSTLVGQTDIVVGP